MWMNGNTQKCRRMWVLLCRAKLVQNPWAKHMYRDIFCFTCENNWLYSLKWVRIAWHLKFYVIRSPHGNVFLYVICVLEYKMINYTCKCLLFLHSIHWNPIETIPPNIISRRAIINFANCLISLNGWVVNLMIIGMSTVLLCQIFFL